MMVFALLCVLVLVLAIVLSRKWNWRWKLLGTLIVSVVWLFALYVSIADDVFRGSESPRWSTSPLKDIIVFLSMLAGMNAKYFWDLIELRRKKNERRKPGQKKHGLEFDFWDFVQPVLVSGIVFATVLHFSTLVSKATLLFSFQNGFFWQTVFGKKLSAVVPEIPEPTPVGSEKAGIHHPGNSGTPSDSSKS